MLPSEQFQTTSASFSKTPADADALNSPTEAGERGGLQETGTTLADNDKWMAANLDKTVQRGRDIAANSDKAVDGGSYAVLAEGGDESALAEDEETILRALGAALITRWNTIPTKLQRELFDCAGSIRDLQQTPPLKEQIARFLHNHKDDERVSTAQASRSDEKRS